MGDQLGTAIPNYGDLPHPHNWGNSSKILSFVEDSFGEFLLQSFVKLFNGSCCTVAEVERYHLRFDLSSTNGNFLFVFNF